MNIFVFGTRGFPNIQGGVEEHCENLYSLVASKRYSVTVFRRKPYIINGMDNYENISFIDLPSTKIPGFEAFFHSFLCTVICIIKRPEIVHVHNIGPGIFNPLLKIVGLKVILTYHSPNYEHSKWSPLIKTFLKLAEYVSIKFADRVIFVSNFQKEKLGVNLKFININNGVRTPQVTNNDDFIKDLGLKRREYILAVGRLVEEKGFDLLINAFERTRPNDLKLVIAGDADHETLYSKRLKVLGNSLYIIFPGFVKGEKLQQLYSHARLFVISSYNEGLPLSLLEAMSYNLPVLASDIGANKQIGLSKDSFFRSGDIESLTKKLDQLLALRFEPVNYNLEPYNWRNIALLTKSEYDKVISDK
ncbi:MAG TPA: glycosyltransferase family 4 protein [Bacteroidales bacterium]|nr:glycosyltransferase family 4 protein [Bacteroidales bacterium]